MKALARPVPTAAALICLVAGALIGLGTGVALEQSRSADPAPTSEAPGPSGTESGTSLVTVAQACSLPSGSLADSNTTLIIDTKGKEDHECVTIEKLSCVLAESGAPQAVVAQMNAIRALYGRQNATWKDLDASWSYSPDDGMQLIITKS
ncbi:hypothetical protein [Brachybacterium nesterenkovii]|uniref:hypothetical protein n=1 Tax=Brachybacterium nesterenkovii TaxID=47847 RepID=UPI003219F502